MILLFILVIGIVGLLLYYIIESFGHLPQEKKVKYGIILSVFVILGVALKTIFDSRRFRN